VSDAPLTKLTDVTRSALRLELAGIRTATPRAPAGTVVEWSLFAAVVMFAAHCSALMKPTAIS
jgi:hypothetical protein